MELPPFVRQQHVFAVIPTHQLHIIFNSRSLHKFNFPTKYCSLVLKQLSLAEYFHVLRSGCNSNYISYPQLVPSEEQLTQQ